MCGRPAASDRGDAVTPLLPVLSETSAGAMPAAASDGAQDCSTCRCMALCWKPRKKTIETRTVVANLLVCRILRGIDRDRSTKLFLALIRPKLRRVAEWVSDQTGRPRRELIPEMESVAIENLLTCYHMGEVVPPLVWLFNGRFGAVRHWAHQMVRRMRRVRRRDWSLTFVDGCDDLEEALTLLNRRATGHRIRGGPLLPARTSDELPDPEREERVRRALAAVEDGRTLTALEYRVMRFCLDHARGARGTDWLHRHLAGVLGVARKDVSRIFAIASRKLVEAAGLRRAYLSARGISAPKRRRVDQTRPLTAEEVITALEMLGGSRGRATKLDIAWACGISDSKLLDLERRYGGMAPAAIREALRR